MRAKLRPLRLPEKMSSRVDHQPVFLLSSKAWRENSLRIEVLSRDYGRVSLIARSARARGSELRGVLVPFVPISVSWFGKEESKTLHRAEWLGGWPQPKNRHLFSALYLNELVLKFTALEDAQPTVYQQFFEAQHAIACQINHQIALRHFEWVLLHASGLLPDVERDNQNQAIDSQSFYFIQPEHSIQKVAADYQHPSGISVSGCLLQEMRAQNLHENSQLNQALALTRLFINYYLPSGITTRQVLQQMGEMKNDFVAQSG